MSTLLDKVFAEVCLDERISDGIFRMDEAEHMNALRDFFLKKGLTKEDAVHITNRMVEGRFPDRQAYRTEDGILVTWPSPKHKQKAMRENPGKYVEKNPFPKKMEPHEPIEKPETKSKEKDVSPNLDKSISSKDSDASSDGDTPGANLFNPEPQTVTQGEKKLSIEPIVGTSHSNTLPQPPQPPPKTSAQISAEREIVKQMVVGDDSALTNISNPIQESYRQEVIKELYKKANELSLKEVVSFLTSYLKL